MLPFVFFLKTTAHQTGPGHLTWGFIFPSLWFTGVVVSYKGFFFENPEKGDPN